MPERRKKKAAQGRLSWIPACAGMTGAYMFSIITCPNPEQLTCVAPSIRRAKS
jgi:hypothetical protein